MKASRVDLVTSTGQFRRDLHDAAAGNPHVRLLAAVGIHKCAAADDRHQSRSAHRKLVEELQTGFKRGSDIVFADVFCGMMTDAPLTSKEQHADRHPGAAAPSRRGRRRLTCDAAVAPVSLERSFEHGQRLTNPSPPTADRGAVRTSSSPPVASQFLRPSSPAVPQLPFACHRPGA